MKIDRVDELIAGIRKATAGQEVKSTAVEELNGWLARNVPEEYRQAELSDGLKEEMPAMSKWQTLTLVGPPGTGKTYAIYAMMITAHKAGFTHPVKVISETDIDRARFDLGLLDNLILHKGVLCLDDIGYKKPNDWNIQALYEITTKRRKSNLHLIMTSNLDKDALTTQYGPAIASRVFGGIVIDTGGEDRRLLKGK